MQMNRWRTIYHCKCLGSTGGHTDFIWHSSMLLIWTFIAHLCNRVNTVTVQLVFKRKYVSPTSHSRLKVFLRAVAYGGYLRICHWLPCPWAKALRSIFRTGLYLHFLFHFYLTNILTVIGNVFINITCFFKYDFSKKIWHVVKMWFYYIHRQKVFPTDHTFII